VRRESYRLATVDGWALKLLGLFPNRSGIDVAHLRLEDPAADYLAIRRAAAGLLKAGHIGDLLSATYSRVIVDEYQDCTRAQHAIVYYAANSLPTVVLGDPLQAIFGWPGNELADWNAHVCKHFPVVKELSTPWRWRNAGAESFGLWLLEMRESLLRGAPIELSTAPSEVSWVHLDGKENRKRQIRAAHVRAPTEAGGVLIIGNSRSPASQQEYAAQIHGAVTVEAVDMKDLVQFARRFDIRAPAALELLIGFAASVMTNVGPADFLRRVHSLERGTARQAASEAERAALRFNADRTPHSAIDLLVEVGKQAGVHTHRAAIFRACIRSLQSVASQSHATLYDAAVFTREQGRALGRSLPLRAVGSTLLLKGLEAEVAVILDARDMDARHLYVAMTRGSKRLIVCSESATLRLR
jgi:DNA helicase-2/ATP-dependent DNA helicase PcrA